MAVTGFWPVFKNLKATLDYADNPDKTTAPEYLDEDLYAALRYAGNDDKTDRKMFVGGINCSAQNAYAEMIAVQRRFCLRDKVVGYHGIQNFREGEVTPEQAFAYKLKMEALSHKGKRTDLTLSQVATKLDTATEIGNCSGESRDTVYRYIRLTHLIPELLDLMDEGKIALMVGEALSYLGDKEQYAVLQKQYDTYNSISYVINYCYPYGYLLC